MEVAKNIFTDGLILDLAPESTGPSCLSYVRNGTLVTFNGNELSLLSDLGNVSMETQLKKGYIPTGVVERGGVLYITSYNLEENECEIGCFPSFSPEEEKRKEVKIEEEVFPEDKRISKVVILVNESLGPGSTFTVGIEDLENILEFSDLELALLTDTNNIIKLPNSTLIDTNIIKLPNFTLGEDDINILNTSISGKLILINKFNKLPYNYRINLSSDEENKYSLTIIYDKNLEFCYDIVYEGVTEKTIYENNGTVEFKNNLKTFKYEINSDYPIQQIEVIPYVYVPKNNLKFLKDYFPQIKAVNDKCYISLEKELAQTIYISNIFGVNDITQWLYDSTDLYIGLSFKDVSNNKIIITGYKQDLNTTSVNSTNNPVTILDTTVENSYNLSLKINLNSSLEPNSLYLCKILVNSEAIFYRWLYYIEEVLFTTPADFKDNKLTDIYTFETSISNISISDEVNHIPGLELKETIKFFITQEYTPNVKIKIFEDSVQKVLGDLAEINYFKHEVSNTEYSDNTQSIITYDFVPAIMDERYLYWYIKKSGLNRLRSGDYTYIHSFTKNENDIYFEPQRYSFNNLNLNLNSPSLNDSYKLNDTVINLINSVLDGKNIFNSSELGIFVPYIIPIDDNLVYVGIMMLTESYQYVPINFIAKCNIGSETSDRLIFPNIVDSSDNVFGIVKNFIASLYTKNQEEKTYTLPKIKDFKHVIDIQTETEDYLVKTTDLSIDLNNNVIIPKQKSANNLRLEVIGTYDESSKERIISIDNVEYRHYVTPSIDDTMTVFIEGNNVNINSIYLPLAETDIYFTAKDYLMVPKYHNESVIYEQSNLKDNYNSAYEEILRNFTYDNPIVETTEIYDKLILLDNYIVLSEQTLFESKEINGIEIPYVQGCIIHDLYTFDKLEL